MDRKRVATELLKIAKELTAFGGLPYLDPKKDANKVPKFHVVVRQNNGTTAIYDVKDKGHARWLMDEIKAVGGARKLGAFKNDGRTVTELYEMYKNY